MGGVVSGWRTRVAMRSSRVSELLIQIGALEGELREGERKGMEERERERVSRVLSTKKEILGVLLTTPASLAAMFVATLHRERQARPRKDVLRNHNEEGRGEERGVGEDKSSVYRFEPIVPFSCTAAGAEMDLLVRDLSARPQHDAGGPRSNQERDQERDWEEREREREEREREEHMAFVASIAASRVDRHSRLRAVISHLSTPSTPNTPIQPTI